MALSPRWGDGATGTGALWQDQFYDRNLLGTAQERWALDAYGNYRVRLPSGELLNGLPTTASRTTNTASCSGHGSTGLATCS